MIFWAYASQQSQVPPPSQEIAKHCIEPGLKNNTFLFWFGLADFADSGNSTMI